MSKLKDNVLMRRLERMKPMKIESIPNFPWMLLLLSLVQIFGMTLAIYAEERNLSSVQMNAVLVFILAVFVFNMVTYRMTQGDHYLVFLATILFAIGSMMIMRLNPTVGVKQVQWFFMGVVAYGLTLTLLRIFKKVDQWMWFYALGGFLLFVMTFAFGTSIFGAKNWIMVGGISIQPAELTKILFVFFLAAFYSNRKRYEGLRIKRLELGKWKVQNLRIGSLIPMLVTYLFVALLFLQKDLGTAAILFGVYFLSTYIYEPNKKILWTNLAFALVGILLGSLLFSHVRVRIQTWLNPWKYIETTGYQITQSLFAIASGGFFGTGIGLGKPNSIPVPEKDFIFAAICEEMGIFVGMGVVMLFLILVYRGFKIALEQKDGFLQVLAFGISSMFAIQALIIVAGVLKLIPLTGVTIPFVSYGGSSVLSSFVALAVLQFASKERRMEEE